MNNTEISAADLAAAKSAARAAYVDPYPGQLGTDRVREDCDRCGGTGVYNAPSGYTIGNPYNRGLPFRGCFGCNGYGYHTVKVSSVRSRVRRHNLEIALRPYRDAIAARNAAAELAAEIERDHAAAIAEQNRRNTLNNTVLGEIGDKIADVPAVVKYAGTFETNYGYSTQRNAFIVLETVDGAAVKVSGTGATLWGHKRGDSVTVVRATVKAFDEYNGQRQTVLTRAVLAARTD